jgi:hypothetical protein
VASSCGNGFSEAFGLSAAPFAVPVWSSPEESQQHSDSILYCSDSESTADLSPPGDAREDFVRTYRETTFFLVLCMVLSLKLLDRNTFMWSMRVLAREGLRLADPLLPKYWCIAHKALADGNSPLSLAVAAAGEEGEDFVRTFGSPQNHIHIGGASAGSGFSEALRDLMNRRRRALVQMILDGLFPGLFEDEREPIEECASAEEAAEDAD